VQPLFGSDRQAALLGDSDEIAKVAKLHPIPPRYGMELTKSFSKAPAEPK
jgi:hypothetical protein